MTIRRAGLPTCVLIVALLIAACSGSADAAADRGAALVVDLGCTACHTGDESGLGPPWQGSWGTDRPLDDGTTARFDAGYVQRAMEAPRTEVLAGYAPTMPAFSVTADELQDIVAYLEALAK